MPKSGAIVNEWVPEGQLWNVDHLTSSGARLALLPDRIDPDTGIAYYKEEVAGTLKLIKKQLADVDFSIPSTQRKYLSEYSIGDVMTFVGVVIIPPLIYDVAKASVIAAAVRVRARLGLSPTDDVAQESITLRVAFLDTGSFEARGIEIIGPVEEVERALLGMVGTNGTEELGEAPDVE
ncbi:hypothetical protein ACRS5S_09130 [Nocardia asiatica]|uniref:hypothetical protein n=1 Tax=Nocardia asiatica TaxID=209252 RepID=UPI003EE3966B